MQYQDDEGDVITVTTSEEFDQALQFAETLNPHLLRLSLQIVDGTYAHKTQQIL